MIALLRRIVELLEDQRRRRVCPTVEFSVECGYRFKVGEDTCPWCHCERDYQAKKPAAKGWPP